MVMPASQLLRFCRLVLPLQALSHPTETPGWKAMTDLCVCWGWGGEGLGSDSGVRSRKGQGRVCSLPGRRGGTRRAWSCPDPSAENGDRGRRAGRRAGREQPVEPEPLPRVRGGGWKGIPFHSSSKDGRARESCGEKAG